METVKSKRTARRATREDIPFLAWCNYEASSPAPGFCYWDPLLEGTGTDTTAFTRAVLHADALAWGSVEEFFVLEEEGKPIAGASAFTMDANDYRPLRLSNFPAVASQLRWTTEARENFLHRYESIWSNPKDETLAPHTSWIIECVAVIPEKRGQGAVFELLRALFDEGRRLGHSHAGISVTEGNEAAKRAYEKAGFQMYLSYGSDYFDGAFPGTVNYRLKL
jgi:ribosomal protein S18 acetylase RimI-like enzyme